jgi:hypothetical protein
VVLHSIQSNNFFIFISHENIRYIKGMVRHVRSISINIRNMRDMVSYFDVLLHLMRVAFYKFDELLAIVIHP